MPGLGGEQRRLAGEHLGHRDFADRVLGALAVERDGGGVDRSPGDLCLGQHVGGEVLDRLEGADRLAELLALLGVGDRQPERSEGEPELLGGGEQGTLGTPGSGEGGVADRFAGGQLAAHVGHRHERVERANGRLQLERGGVDPLDPGGAEDEQQVEVGGMLDRHHRRRRPGEADHRAPARPDRRDGWRRGGWRPAGRGRAQCRAPRRRAPPRSSRSRRRASENTPSSASSRPPAAVECPAALLVRPHRLDRIAALAGRCGCPPAGWSGRRSVRSPLGSPVLRQAEDALGDDVALHL